MQRDRVIMWLKLVALGLVAIGLTGLLLMPIGPVDITVQMPAVHGTPVTIDNDRFETIIGVLAGVIAFVLVAAPFAFIGWMMWRVVRHLR
jgi:hypothetical protein